MSANTRKVALNVLVSAAGSLSFLGSIWSLRASSKLLDQPYHRIVFGMSLSDALASAALALNTLPIPTGSPAYGAAGNIASCSAQGFFVQLGLATQLYSACLAVFFLVVVKMGWRHSNPKLKSLEIGFHVFVWLVAGCTSFASLGLKLYNNANLWCWIAPLPLDCTNSIESRGEGNCIRGDNAWVYRVSFYFVWVWIGFIVVAACMVLLIFAYKAQREKMAVYRQQGEEANSSFFRTVVLQAFLYIGSFLLTAAPLSIARMLQAKYNCTATYFPLSIATAIFYPLQGFWNALIYNKPFEKIKPEDLRTTVVSSSSALQKSLRSMSVMLKRTTSDDSLGLQANAAIAGL